MHQTECNGRMTNVAARRRWMSALLCVLIALSIILHLGQAMPAQADMIAIQVVTATESAEPCETSDHPGVDCHTANICSLYPPNGAAPPVLDKGQVRLPPSKDTVPVTWAISPQLEPPQHSP